MVIALLVISELAETKLSRRAISRYEVAQMRRNGLYATRNPHPRVEGSRLVVGQTDGGRFITLILQPDAVDPAIWHVMTGWTSTARERKHYRRRG